MVTSPSDLHELAVRSQRLAQDATLLAWLEDETLNYLSPGRPVSVLVADTLFAERYNDLTACLAWLSGAYRLWLRANQRFIGEAGRQIFYRFVLLPIPRVLKSWPIRRLLIDTILLHLHVQLWHGVVCGISFVDPRSSRTKRQLRDLNFVAIPAHRTVFDTPAYYHVEELGTKVLVDSVADIRCAEFREIIGRSPIW